MANKIVEYKLESGGSVFIEVEETELDRGRSPVSKKSGVPEEATKEFEKALDGVKPAADLILQKLQNFTSKPDNIEIDFGIKMSAEAGAIIATTAVEANFTVKLSWGKG